MEEPALESEVSIEETPVEETPEAPAWTGPSQEEWSTVTQSLASLSESLQPAPVETVQPGIESYGDESGELTMEGLSRFVQDQINAGVESRLGQFEPVLNQTVADRGEALIAETFDKLAKPQSEGGSGLGDFDRKLARTIAEGYAAQGIDPNSAIQQAAQYAREIRDAERKAGGEELRTTLENIGNAPREPGVNGAGVPTEGPPEGASSADKYKWIADNWSARTRL